MKCMTRAVRGDVEVHVDFGAAHVRVRRHGVPVAAGREMRDAHDKLATARALQKNNLQMVRLLQVSRLPSSVGTASSLRTSATGLDGVGGIAQQIVDWRRSLSFDANATCLLPRADVEHIEIVEARSSCPRP